MGPKGVIIRGRQELSIRFLLALFREKPHWILSLTNPSPTSAYHRISRRIKGLFSSVLPRCATYVLLVWAQIWAQSGLPETRCSCGIPPLLIPSVSQAKKCHFYLASEPLWAWVCCGLDRSDAINELMNCVLEAICPDHSFSSPTRTCMASRYGDTSDAIASTCCWNSAVLKRLSPSSACE